MATNAGSRSASGAGVRPERTPVKFIARGGARLPLLDRLRAGCSHCGGAVGRLTRHLATRRAVT